jgi:hypothetical protein
MRGRENGAVTGMSKHASSEVSLPRRFSPAYKLKILAEIDAAAEKVNRAI